ncbi:MAG: endonuclease III domain-containing protein [Chloroflexota bacterium]
MTVRSSEPLEARVEEIARLLEEEYGRPAPRRRMRPLDELVLTILSQHTSDANSSRAFQGLKERFESWEAVRDADQGAIAEAIRSGGLARIKAGRIKDLLLRLSEERGSLDLDFLRGSPLDEAREYLLRLDGVGPKTAACVLLFSCDLPAFPVDTHIHRVTRRLGLIGPTTSAEEAHRILESVVPAAEVYPFHVNVITHGRRVCKAQRPRCDACVLAPKCEYFAGEQSAVSSQPSAAGD